MSTLTRPHTKTRPADRRRRPQPRYRPPNAPRTTIARPPSTAPRATARPTPIAAPAPIDQTAACAACARTRRFERRVGEVLRRGLALAACAGLAVIAAGVSAVEPAAPVNKPVPASATTTTHGLVAPPAPSLYAWCATTLLAGNGCPPNTPAATAEDTTAPVGARGPGKASP